MTDRKAYIDRMAEQLKNWDDEIAKLEGKLKGRKSEWNASLQAELLKIKEKRNTMQVQLNDLKKAGDAAWQDMVEGLEKSWLELKTAVQDAYNRFRE